MAKLDVVEFECPRCLEQVRAPIGKAGEWINCPSCEGSLVVPLQSAGQAIFDDLFDSDATEESAPSPGGNLPADESQAPITESPPAAEDEEDLLAGLAIPGESESGQPKKLAGKDPFKVDPDAPLKVDGVGDFYSHKGIFAITCHVCDTRIDVWPEQINTEVGCPECYSQVLVEAPTDHPAQKWLQEGRGLDTKREAEDDELKLSEPVERPKVDYPIDESFGLEAPSKDLLAPKPEHDGPDVPYVEIVDESDEASTSVPSQRGAAKPEARERSLEGKKSRREMYEDAQRKQQAAETGTVYRPAEAEATELSDTENYPDTDFGSLLAAAIEMLRSPGAVRRTSLAIALMCFGTIAMQWVFPSSAPNPGDGEATGSMVQRLMVSAQWIIIGLIPYLIGVVTLWFTAGYIFRDAALGKRQVESWKNAGRSEVTATFLLFAFGFFIGGLPAAFVTLMILPMRVIFGPLLLLGAWYSQQPFSIVNVDAFQNFSKQVLLWTSFYTFMAALALVGFVAGLVFWMRAFIPGSAFVLTMLVSVIGVVMVAAVTLIFAAVCGWHCGRVADALEN